MQTPVQSRFNKWTASPTRRNELRWVVAQCLDVLWPRAEGRAAQFLATSRSGSSLMNKFLRQLLRGVSCFCYLQSRFVGHVKSVFPVRSRVWIGNCVWPPPPWWSHVLEAHCLPCKCPLISSCCLKKAAPIVDFWRPFSLPFPISSL